MESKFIWMNGELVPFEQATVHFLTPALHYGLGAFEGIRCYNTPRGPAVFRLSEHLQRLLDSIHILGVLEFPYSLEQLRTAVHETIRANGFSECYVRPLVYMGNGPLGLNLDASTPLLGIAVWEWGAYLGEEALEKGIRMMVASFTRPHPNSVMTKAKITGNYPNSVMAKTLALRAGFDEAIMLDPQGYVAECTGENLFVVRHGKIYTPYTATVLEGITRDTVVTVARDLGYEVLEQPISRDQLYIADEAFVCGTAAECIGLSEIDFRTIGDGKMGPITRTIQSGYRDLIRGRVAKYEEWCDHVGEKVESTVFLQVSQST
jgi:branched-chain amino acid aminotransferase